MSVKLLLLVTFFFTTRLYAQDFATDRLLNNLRSPSVSDSNKIEDCLKIFLLYQRTDIDSSFIYAKKILKIEEDFNNPFVKAAGYLAFGYAYFRINDYSKLLEYTLSATKILEAHPDSLLMAYVYNFHSLVEKEPQQKIAWLRKAIESHNALVKKDCHSIIFFNNIGYSYHSVNNIDSGFYFANKAYAFIKEIKDTLSPIFTFSLLTNLYDLKGDLDSSRIFSLKCVDIADETKYPRDIASAYNNLGDNYYYHKDYDSAIACYYTVLSLAMSESSEAKYSAENLYYIYKRQKNSDSALLFLEISAELNKKVNNVNTRLRVQAQAYEESQRQNELLLDKIAKEENRKHNLQILLIVIVLLSSFILFFVVSKSVKINIKYIKFLGVVILLVTFEFINLLLHPFLENIFHHSLILMLLSLVVIASIITPVHHYLEKALKNRIDKKNERLRQTDTTSATTDEQKPSGAEVH